VDGGGGTSNRESYAVSGTAGQPDAGAMSGGNYIVTGGFWGTEGALRGIRYDVYLPTTLKTHEAYRFYEGSFETEDNDFYTQANGAMYSEKDYYGHPDDAKDYWSLYMETPGTVIVDLTDHVGDGVQLQLLYKGASNRVDFSLAPPYHIEYNGLEGWYYIYIYTASGYDDTTQYTLRATFP
jgi:hypothetical protein